MTPPFSGGCRCGAVRYACSAEPFLVAHCHCRDCQYASGGPSSTVVLVPRAALAVDRGEPREFTVDAESGNQVTRKFCGNCGSPLFSELSGQAGICAIKAGSLDDPSWLAPAAHIWTKSALPWALPEDGLPRIEENPG